MKSFIRETLARIVGDTDTVIAERNYRTAKAIVNGQIHSLNSQKVKDEVVLEKAQASLISAKFPGFEIDDDTYLSNIHSRQQDVIDAEAELKDTEEAIKYNEKLLEEFEKEVEAPKESK